MHNAEPKSWRQRVGPHVFYWSGRLLRERRALAAEQQQDSILYDPIEDDPQLQAILAEADALAEAQAPDRGMGSCFAYWAAKKRILWRRFGIRWFDPADMNPRVTFD